MKKILLFMALSFVLFSCKNDDDSFVRFEKSSYTIHYDQSVNLGLVSSEYTSLFRYFVSDANIINISLGGLASGKYIGQTAVVAKYNDLSAECTVIVEPYEKLYNMIPLITGGIERSTVKVLESAIGRDTLPAPMNKLIVTPMADDLSLKTLEYLFEDDKLVSVSAFLKEDTTDDKITIFLSERYPYREDAGYADAGSGAKVEYISTENKVEYTW